jgi:hypothetical protein
MLTPDGALMRSWSAWCAGFEGWLSGWVSGRYAFIGILVALKYHAGFAECHSGVLSQGELTPATLVQPQAFG